MEKLRRITVIVPEQVSEEVCKTMIELGVSGYTTTNVFGVERHQIHNAEANHLPSPRIITKIETIVPQSLGNESSIIAGTKSRRSIRIQ